MRREQAAARDQRDELARLRRAYAVPDGLIYLDGNSLGALSHLAATRVADAVSRAWGQDLIRSWNQNGWMDAPVRVGDAIGALVGAAPGQTVVTDSTTINLFRLLGATVRARPSRPVVLLERGNFPADNYIAQGLAAFLGDGVELRYVNVDDDDALLAALDERVAVLELSHVDYRSGRLRPMQEIAARARAVGAWTCWDLAHSAGALPVHLDDAGVELAVGCGYKYLNGGPGAPAFLFVRADLQSSLTPPMWGWLGHAEPFALEPDFRPATGMRRFVCGTPPVLSLCALEAGVEVLASVSMAQLRRKSLALTDLFMALVDEFAGAHGLELSTPRDHASRGSQVLWRHPHGYAVVRALIDRGVIGDFRAPDGMRFGFAPAYLRFVDVWDAADALRDVLENETWRRPEYERRHAVT